MAQIRIYPPEAQNLQQIIAAENAGMAEEGVGTKFSVQPIPQPGQGCRERYGLWHSCSNGVPISKTEIGIAFGGQIVAIHTKFRWD